MARVITLRFASPQEFALTQEEEGFRDLITGERRSTNPPFITPGVEEATARLRLAQAQLRQAQIRQYLETPVGFEYRADPQNPRRFIPSPIKRPTPTPEALAQLFPVAQPPGAAGAGQRNIFKGTITAPDGRVIELYEPEGGEPFTQIIGPSGTLLQGARTLFGGRPIRTAQEREIRELREEVGELRRRAAPARVPQEVGPITFPETPPHFTEALPRAQFVPSLEFEFTGGTGLP